MTQYSTRPYVLAETNWKTVQENDYSVAILPWGATEAHNYHLPYATDNFQVDHVMIQAAQLAWEQGAKTIVLPCIPFGVNTCLLYTSPSPRDATLSRMPSSA